MLYRYRKLAWEAYSSTAFVFEDCKNEKLLLHVLMEKLL